jgi:hypothetical protein
MKYETPELTTLTPAISAIQGAISKDNTTGLDSVHDYEFVGVYQDWE